MKTLLIGFGYKARHGKDTSVKAIIDAYKDKYDVRRYAFGDDLKREIEELGPFELCMKYGIPYDTNPDMTDPLCPSRHGKQNKLQQFWGEYQNSIDPFYWVKKIRAKIEADQPQIALISDLRRKKELGFVKAFGGFTVKVSRYGYVDPSRDPKHNTETELDDVKFDYEIQVLDGEVDQLKSDALCVFDMIVASMAPEVPESLVV